MLQIYVLYKFLSSGKSKNIFLTETLGFYFFTFKGDTFITFKGDTFITCPVKFVINELPIQGTYGYDRILQWKFETWNEPDLQSYNILNFTLNGNKPSIYFTITLNSDTVLSQIKRIFEVCERCRPGIETASQ